MKTPYNIVVLPGGHPEACTSINNALDLIPQNFQRIIPDITFEIIAVEEMLRLFREASVSGLRPKRFASDNGWIVAVWPNEMELFSFYHIRISLIADNDSALENLFERDIISATFECAWSHKEVVEAVKRARKESALGYRYQSHTLLVHELPSYLLNKITGMFPMRHADLARFVSILNKEICSSAVS